MCSFKFWYNIWVSSYVQWFCFWGVLVQDQLRFWGLRSIAFKLNWRHSCQFQILFRSIVSTYLKSVIYSQSQHIELLRIKKLVINHYSGILPLPYYFVVLITTFLALFGHIVGYPFTINTFFSGCLTSIFTFFIVVFVFSVYIFGTFFFLDLYFVWCPLGEPFVTFFATREVTSKANQTTYDDSGSNEHSNDLQSIILSDTHPPNQLSQLIQYSKKANSRDIIILWVHQEYGSLVS